MTDSIEDIARALWEAERLTSTPAASERLDRMWAVVKRCRQEYDRRLTVAVAVIDVMRGAADDGAIGRRLLALAATWEDCQETTAGGRIFRHCGREVRAAVGAPMTAGGDDRG